MDIVGQLRTRIRKVRYKFDRMAAKLRLYGLVWISLNKILMFEILASIEIELQ